eukprot:scaffold4709_cov212-Amphora_coffeaeformis.AAC.3
MQKERCFFTRLVSFVLSSKAFRVHKDDYRCSPSTNQERYGEMRVQQQAPASGVSPCSCTAPPWIHVHFGIVGKSPFLIDILCGKALRVSSGAPTETLH